MTARPLVTFGRLGPQLQISIVCASEDEAKAILARITTDLRDNGATSIPIVGTLDEGMAQ